MAAKWEARAAEPFADPTRLTNWVTWALCALAIMCLIAIATGLMERDVLLRIQAGDFSSEAEAQAVADASDARGLLVSFTEVAVFVLTAGLALKWIYDANLNARRLGARGLIFPPGMAAGYYFIPILNVWRPYQAMREIWKASAEPENWEAQKTPVLFPIWWGLWITAGVLGQVSFRAQTRAEELPELFAANALGIAAAVAEIALCIAFLLVIRQIYRLQMQRSVSAPQPRLDRPATVPS